MEMRLHKYLAHCGVASRRKAETLIEAGIVSVNGSIVTEQGLIIDTEKDRVAVNGEPVRQETKVYVLLHKPKDYVTTSEDELGRRTVLDLIEGVPVRLYAVGRLDRDSEGLIMLTNDGDMALYLTHPRYGVPKTYRVTVEGFITDEDIRDISEGVRVGGKLVQPLALRVLERNKHRSRIEIEVTEGINREVRRIFAAVGHEARKLIRLAIGPLSLEGIPKGRSRYLLMRELNTIQKSMRDAGFETQTPQEPPKRKRTPASQEHASAATHAERRPRPNPTDRRKDTRTVSSEKKKPHTKRAFGEPTAPRGHSGKRPTPRQGTRQSSRPGSKRRRSD